jgi:hypothetical protein
MVPDPVIPGADEYQRKLSFEITEALAKRKPAKDALDSPKRMGQDHRPPRPGQAEGRLGREAGGNEGHRDRVPPGLGGQGQVAAAIA